MSDSVGSSMIKAAATMFGMLGAAGVVVGLIAFAMFLVFCACCIVPLAQEDMEQQRVLEQQRYERGR